MTRRKQQGFTIVEIVVVVIVIAVLSSMTVLLFTQAQKNSRDRKRDNDIKLLMTELDKYYEKNGELPLSCDVGYPVNCSGDVSSYQSSTGKTPLDTISSTMTAKDLQTILPGISDSFGDPQSTTGKPINQRSPSWGLGFSRYGYYLLSLDLWNLGTTSYFTKSDSSTTGLITCNYSAIGYDSQGNSHSKWPHYYVVGYFSETKDKWVFYRGPFLKTLNNTRWNYDNKPECVHSNQTTN